MSHHSYDAPNALWHCTKTQGDASRATITGIVIGTKPTYCPICGVSVTAQTPGVAPCPNCGSTDRWVGEASIQCSKCDHIEAKK